MNSLIAVTSGKGGVGKTIISAALAVGLARMGRKVLLIDGDLGLRNLDLVLGMENEILYTLWDLARGLCLERETILPVCGNLDFLAASQTDSWEDVSGEAILTVFEDIRQKYDFVIVDSPAGIGRGFRYALDMADESIVVTAPTRTSRRAAEKVVQLLGAGHSRVWMLFNDFRPGKTGRVSFEEMLSVEEPEHFLGVVPHSEEIVYLSENGDIKNFPANSSFGEAIRLVLRVLTEGKEYPDMRWNRILQAAERENNTSADGKTVSDLRRILRRSQNWRRRRR